MHYIADTAFRVCAREGVKLVIKFCFRMQSADRTQPPPRLSPFRVDAWQKDRGLAPPSFLRSAPAVPEARCEMGAIVHDLFLTGMTGDHRVEES